MLIFALGMIISGAVWLIWLEIKTIRFNSRKQRRRSAWPTFVDLYVSAIQSGVSLADAFSYVADFQLPEFQQELRQLDFDLAKGRGFVDALQSFKKRLGFSQADLFVESLTLAFLHGSQNVIDFLENQASSVRTENSTQGAIEARNGAIITVAKLGLLAPWIMVAVLSVNETNRAAYFSDAGGILLFMGFAISLVAYRLIITAGRSYETRRLLGVTDV